MAAGKSKNLTIRFIADTASASKNIDALNAKLNNFGKTATGSPTGKGKGGVIGGTGSAMSSLSNATGGLGGKFMALAGPIGIAAAALTTLTFGMKNVVSSGIEAEDAITKLGVLFKNEVKAMDVYQKALEKSVVTPFDPKDIVAAAVQAQGYIGKAGDVFTKGLFGMKGDAATLIADMAAFSGQTAVEASTALFRADLALLDKYGADARRVYAKAKKVAAVGSEKFVQTFVKGMSQITTWQGMAAKRSATISGLVSTIKGNIGLIFTFLSGATERKGVVTFWSSLRTIMTEISNGLGKFVQEIKPVLTIVGAILGNAMARVWAIIQYMWSIIGPFVKAIWSIVLPIIKILFAISNFLTKIFVSVFKLVGGMEVIVRGWLASLLGISTGISTVVGWLEKLLLWLNMIFTLVMGGIDGWITKIFTWIKSLPDLIKWVLQTAWIYIKENLLLSGVKLHQNLLQNKEKKLLNDFLVNLPRRVK
jgi:hypothetical protein